MKKLMSVCVALTLAGTALVIGCSGDDDAESTSSSSGGTTSSSSGGTSSSSGGSSSGGSSSGDAGGDAAASCVLCSYNLEHGPGNSCADNGPPSSLDLLNAVFDCACVTNGGACTAACGNTCTNLSAPSQSCGQCIFSACAAEVDACAADDGTTPSGDAGSDASASDSGSDAQ